jgi:hypothetical protein
MLPRRSLKLSANPSRFVRQKLLPLVLGGVLLVFLYHLFLIRHVNCTLNGGPCPDNISEKLKVYLGESSIFLDQKSLSANMRSLYTLEQVGISFRLGNKLQVDLKSGNLSYNAKVYLVQDLPQLSMDNVPVGTVSAGWTKPTTEIEQSLLDKEGHNFDLWENGTITAAATSEAKIIYLFKEKPDQEITVSIFKALKIISRYVDFSRIYILGQDIFLRQESQPDIIVYVPFDEGSLVEALQSFAYLATIKKDAKVVDLRFKNPIIR